MRNVALVNFAISGVVWGLFYGSLFSVLRGSRKMRMVGIAGMMLWIAVSVYLARMSMSIRTVTY